ncbi:MAG: sporulation peptidase YabG [Bacilli bacterium]|nr:peptidase [Erysipelotrichaceae bacterium]MDD6250188.1 sporulation peptidase YabG [Bacillales bacterium]MDY2745810.1 sporulation peptidase YabG [Bacilli bacterium]MDD7381602.1 sporulation peptidase YabG [Bacillales bacterium]MDY3889657.1 sporulation peptidase YabG [Bacilli bacterium]
MFKVNDLVTRSSYSNDVIFRIISIDNGNVKIKGEVIRLIADAPISDLVSYDVRNKVKFALPSLSRPNNLIGGRILHIDGDAYYLSKAIETYKSYNIEAYGYYIEENKIEEVIISLIQKHNPDIVVITGHDSLKQKEKIYELESYQNSAYFVNAIKRIRSIYRNKDELIIIAGACQSYYEKLIESGANFASSPSRKNIHLFDPVIVASLVSLTRIYEIIDIDKMIELTYSKEIGGIDTKGVARRNIYKKK